MLVLAKAPVVSVNGNAAALVPGELVELGRVLGAPLEVNIFHMSSDREHAIRDYLLEHRAPRVLERFDVGQCPPMPVGPLRRSGRLPE